MRMANKNSTKRQFVYRKLEKRQHFQLSYPCSFLATVSFINEDGFNQNPPSSQRINHSKTHFCLFYIFVIVFVFISFWAWSDGRTVRRIYGRVNDSEQDRNASRNDREDTTITLHSIGIVHHVPSKPKP
jgi:hypothetical protein